MDDADADAGAERGVEGGTGSEPASFRPGGRPSGEGTGGGRAARPWWAALRRRSSAAAVRCAGAVRAVPVGVAVAALVALLGMAVVLRLAGAWPFARDDTAVSGSVPGARLPLPPSAVGAGGSRSGRESGDEDGEDRNEGRNKDRRGDGKGRAHGEDDGSRRMMSSRAPGPDMAAPGEGAGRETSSRGCRADWHLDGQWEDFNATVRVTNTSGVPVNGWRVTWRWPYGQRLIKGWNADFRESGAAVTVRDVDSNAEIATAGEVTFGFQATGSGSPAPRLTCRVL